jgi:Undecaprenyl-phosphate galactose phosphotransferase WbaP
VIWSTSSARVPVALPVGRWLRSRKRLLVVPTLILSDVLLALAMWGAASVLQAVLGHGQPSGIAVASILPNVAAWVGVRAVLGLYPGYGLDQVEELRRQTFALLTTLAVIAVSAFVSEVHESLYRILHFGWALGLLLAAPMVRYFVKWAMKAALWGKPVVVLGTQEAGAQLMQVLQKEWQLGFRAIGIFEPRSAGASGNVTDEAILTDAMAVAREYGADTAIFATPPTRREYLVRLVDLANTTFRYVIVMSDLGGITNSAVIARNFAGNFGVEIKHNLLFPWARRSKRLLDLLLIVVGGLLISLPLIVLVVLVKLDSSGPAFYGHRRLGAEGKHFRCWKFRTMYTNAEQLLDEYLHGDTTLWAEWEQTFKLRHDPRVTRVGRFLRKTSLDELPQLWNVLRGEMSLVGPRPIVDAEIPKYGTVYEMYQRTKPGISGLWQVSGRNDTTYTERVKLDAYYVQNWSVWLDIVILARTVRSVILRQGAY